MEAGSDVGAGAGCVGTDAASAASFLSSEERRCSREFRRITESCGPIEFSLAVRSCTRIYATIAIMDPAISKPTMRTAKISIVLQSRLKHDRAALTNILYDTLPG